MRVDNSLYVARKFQDILRVRGIAAIHQQAAPLARQHDNVVPRSRNQAQLVGELGRRGSGLRKADAGQSNRRNAATNCLEKITPIEVLHATYCIARPGLRSRSRVNWAP
jgi:hypothetical protein